MSASVADSPARCENETPPDLRYAWRALSVVTSASFFTSLNFSSLTIALPDIVRHFDASSTEASWIVVVFGLVATCATLACGRISDAIDRRTLYLASFALFAMASLLAGFAPSVRALIGLQGLQALGDAMLMANSAVIVASVFPRELVGRALGIYLAGFSVAALAGPVVGGVLATALGWRWVFWFNVPLGIACIVWGALVLRSMPAERAESAMPAERAESAMPAERAESAMPPARCGFAFDMRGNLLLVLGLGGFIVALSSVGPSGWASSTVRIGAACAVVFLPVFIWAQLRTADPVLDVRALAHRPLAVALSAGGLHATATGGVIVLVALYLQSVGGASAARAGVLVLPFAAANVIASASVGVLTSRLAPRTVGALGALGTSAGLLVLLGVALADAPPPAIIVGLVLVGLGSGVFQAANAAATLADIDSAQLGRTNAARITVQNTAYTTGVALGLTLVAAALPGDLKAAVFEGAGASLRAGAQDQLAHGFAVAFAAAAALAICAVATSLLTRGARPSRERSPR